MTSIRRAHPAWIVLGGVTLCTMAGAGLRAVFGIYIKPMEAEFGWGRGALSGAAAISLLLLGAAGLALAIREEAVVSRPTPLAVPAPS